MSDLQTQFEAAVANSKSLSERPDNTTLLKIYGLYKQATAGDNTEKKPGFSAFSAEKRERREVAVINGGDPNCLTRNPEVK